MFILTTLSDNVRVNPADFHLPRCDAIEQELNKKYANKVLHNVGLCIRVFDFTHISDGIIHSCQDGSYVSKVIFRLVVFRPFIGEILVGKISSSSPNGIRVSLNFFDEIVVPAEWVKENSIFDNEEGVWVWQVVSDEDDPENVTKLFMDKGDLIRVRVETESFVDIGPMKHQEDEDHPSPYTLTCSIVEPGLGCCSWWDEEIEQES